MKDEVLCIPTAFCSYTGEALDKKTPLLRSMVAIDEQANRVLKLFGEGHQKVVTTVGAEQEYFLISEKDYAKRLDLVLTGRTLFGYPPCKGQELEEHYFGAIRPTVNEFMKELDDELWKLGVSAKTKHNEVAPAQHELAPIFSNSNRAIDENLLTMEKMKLLASHHGLVCLQHEKPFEGINGSGKHNNWAISAGKKNLLDPGENPMENLRFLVFLTGVIQAVDDYQELLRMSVASAGNDHRLGANEAPPAIVSIFLGDELGAIVDALISDKEYTSAERVAMDLGVAVLPNFLKDNTDRNRTSPFAFTGNKFEFRMPGSAVNLSDANTILNTAMAKSLKEFADAMEGKSGDEFEAAAIAYIKDDLRKHQRIIFNGNGYGEEWLKEAERRGLLNLRTTPDCAHAYLDQKNVELFIRHSVYSEIELAARYKMKLDNYCKVLRIEAETMLHMLRRDILPAVSAYSAELANAAISKQELGIECSFEKDGAAHISRLISSCCDVARELDAAIADVSALPENYTRAVAGRDRLIPTMTRLRSLVDELEVHTSAEYWPMPTYGEILFSVN